MKRLNLIPRQTESAVPLASMGTFLKKPSRRAVWIIGILFLAFFISQYGIGRYHNWKLTQAKNQVEVLKVRSNRLQTKELAIAKEKVALLKKRALAEERLEYLKNAKADKPAELSKALIDLPALIPEDIWINKLSVNREGMVVNGSTVNNDAVAQFMNALNKSSKFKDSTFNFTQKSQIGDATLYTFEITTHPVN